MRMSCLTGILTTLIFKLVDSTAEQPYNTEEHHHGYLNFLQWPDMQERPSLITC